MAIGNIPYVRPSEYKRLKSKDYTDGDTEPAADKSRTEDVHCDHQQPLSGEAEGLGIVKRPSPAFPEYVTLPARINSFEDYPPTCKNNPLRMAKAGLFYNGFGENDRVVCFQCSGAMYLWDDDDDPLEEHARWYPSCPFVRLALGQSGVQLVSQAHQEALKRANELEGSEEDLKTLTQYYSKHEAVRFFESFGITEVTLYNAMKAMKENGEDITDADKVEAAIKKLVAFEKRPVLPTPPKSEVSLCAVCRQEERGIIFFPCGHVATCVNCASSTKLCPICRGAINGSMKAFLS